MSALQFDSEHDEWSEWLLGGRHGNDPAYERHIRTDVERFAKRVLDGARLSPGMTIADIGAGEGLIAFAAIDRIGSSVRAILTDVSQPMLRHAQMVASQRGIEGQCTFLQCSAERLDGILDESVDVVTTRAVLAYVAEKGKALSEFYRVLKPGGSLSIAEPILRDEAFETIALKKSIDAMVPESRDLFLTLLHRWKASQFPDTEEQMAQNPLVNYSERDLVQFARCSGFTAIQLEFCMGFTSSQIKSWDVFIAVSPHPWALPLGDVMAKQFTPEEQNHFEKSLRPIVEAGQFSTIERVAYLTAKKPIV